MTTQRTTYEPIPQPPGYPVLGNLFDVRGADTPIQALMKLACQYGPIFRLRVGPRNLVVVSGFDLVDEICDDERFDKSLGAGAINARAFALPHTYCWWHDPANAEQRRRAASKGGKCAGRGRPQTELADIKQRLSDLAEQVLEGTVERGVAGVASQVLNVYLRAVSVEMKVREVTELEERLEEVEEILRQRKDDRWGA